MSSEKKPQPVKRWDERYHPDEDMNFMVESDNGGWVRYSDHEATIEALRAERDEARRKATYWKATATTLNRLCDKTADHRAIAEARVAQLEAGLRLHVAYEALPVDRGGKSGPKGKAWTAFIEARDRALLSDGGRS